MAFGQRYPRLALLHHLDQGSQYTDGQYQAVLREHGIQASVIGAGTWYDNGPMESVFGMLKDERVHHLVYHKNGEAHRPVPLHQGVPQSSSASLVFGLPESSGHLITRSKARPDTRLLRFAQTPR
jgi:transposase InsO family protein